MISNIPVHTIGINWESVGVIIGGLAAAFAAVQTFTFAVFSRRDRIREKAIAQREKERDEERQEVRNLIGHAMSEQTAALNHQTEVLMSRLETKEVVAEISVRLARVEGARGISSPAGHT